MTPAEPAIGDPAAGPPAGARSAAGAADGDRAAGAPAGVRSAAGQPPDVRSAAGQRAVAVAPSVLREMNQRLLLDQLFAGGPATRPRLARDAGLSLPTVIAALADLENAELVRPAGRADTAQGRPATRYEANPSAGLVVGVDVGRERLRLAVADLAG
ncbi:MAG: hypothetical protein QOI68_2916, partial [Pseudonocardiales bacterium]|nr:hypothetical protein [Pseudonocardiales bacterium]